MSYEKFVKGVIWKVGFETKIHFENDGEKYTAYITGELLSTEIAYPLLYWCAGATVIRRE